MRGLLPGLTKGSLALGMCVGINIAAAAETSSKPVVSYQSRLPVTAVMVLDTRPASQCQAASLPGAHCMPAADFFGQHKRLANWSGLLWALGTVGLTGSEHVAIIGVDEAARDFVAGLLYVAGQREVTVVTTPASSLLQGVDQTPGGIVRASTRQQVWQSSMRSDAIVLRNELIAAIRSDRPPVLFDGRTESEYWGQVRESQRGGHLPGALHSPVMQWRAGVPEQVPAATVATPVIYSRNAVSGLAYLARVHAAGQTAKLYLAGWQEWASDGALPIDAASYPESTTSGQHRSQTTSSTRWTPATIIGAVLIGAALLLTGYALGQRNLRQSEQAQH